MSNEEKNILKQNHGQKSIKVLLVIDVGFETIPKKSTCDNNPEPSCLTKINKNIACGFSVFVKDSYDNSANEQNFKGFHQR